MKVIYVCSPCRGNPPYSGEKTAENIRLAGVYCGRVVEAGHVPVAPHYFYREWLSDSSPQERARALKIGLRLLEKCNEVWVFGQVSKGMADEIAFAEARNIRVAYK